MNDATDQDRIDAELPKPPTAYDADRFSAPMCDSSNVSFNTPLPSTDGFWREQIRLREVFERQATEIINTTPLDNNSKPADAASHWGAVEVLLPDDPRYVNPHIERAYQIAMGIPSGRVMTTYPTDSDKELTRFSGVHPLIQEPALNPLVSGDVPTLTSSPVSTPAPDSPVMTVTVSTGVTFAARDNPSISPDELDNVIASNPLGEVAVKIDAAQPLEPLPIRGTTLGTMELLFMLETIKQKADPCHDADLGNYEALIDLALKIGVVDTTNTDIAAQLMADIAKPVKDGIIAWWNCLMESQIEADETSPDYPNERQDDLTPYLEHIHDWLVHLP